MAVTFGRGASNQATPAGTSLAVTITLNAGETGILVFGSSGTTSSLPTVSSISGGGTWTQLVAPVSTAAGFARAEVWTTGANGATSTSTVTINFSGGSPSAVAAAVAAYLGVGSFGATTTNTLAQAVQTVSMTMQDANNFIVGLFANDQGATPHAPFTAGNFRNAGFTTTAAIDATAWIGDNTIATASSVAVTSGDPGFPVNWAVVGLELRSVGGSSSTPPMFRGV